MQVMQCTGQRVCRRNCSGLRHPKTGAPLCTTCWIAEYDLNNPPTKKEEGVTT